MIEQKQNKRFFLMRNDVPTIDYNNLDIFQDQDLIEDKNILSDQNPSINFKDKVKTIEDDRISQKTVSKKLTNKAK